MLHTLLIIIFVILCGNLLYNIFKDKKDEYKRQKDREEHRKKLRENKKIKDIFIRKAEENRRIARKEYKDNIECLLNKFYQIVHKYNEHTQFLIRCEIDSINLKGFRRYDQNKISNFQNKKLESICRKSFNKFTSELESLARELDRAEKELDRKFQKILLEYASICRQLKIKEPDIAIYEKIQTQGIDIIPGVPNKDIVKAGFLLTGLSIGICNFTQAAYADPTTQTAIAKSSVEAGGAAHGGAVHGGAVHGGAVHGGAVHGGAVHGGILHGGILHGGILHGGILHGGAAHGVTLADKPLTLS